MRRRSGGRLAIWSVVSPPKVTRTETRWCRKPRCPISPWKESPSPSLAPPLMTALRRYEILLPLRFNDGQPVPPELLAKQVKADFQQLDSWLTSYPIEVL